MDTIVFASDELEIAVLTDDKQLVKRTPHGDRKLNVLPPHDDPEFKEKFRVWRTAALLKWGQTQVVGKNGEDLPQVENGELPIMQYDRKIKAYRIV